jgi:hypothetical protein
MPKKVHVCSILLDCCRHQTQKPLVRVDRLKEYKPKKGGHHIASGRRATHFYSVLNLLQGGMGVEDDTSSPSSNSSAVRCAVEIRMLNRWLKLKDDSKPIEPLLPGGSHTSEHAAFVHDPVFHGEG